MKDFAKDRGADWRIDCANALAHQGLLHSPADQAACIAGKSGGCVNVP